MTFAKYAAIFCVATIACGSSHLPPAPPAPPPVETADSVMKRVRARYEAARTYRDEGSVEEAHAGPIDRSKTLYRFTTAFERPNHFRFEFVAHYEQFFPDNAGVIWTDSGGFWSSMSERPEPRSHPTLEDAAFAFAGVSRGSSRRIPALLVRAPMFEQKLEIVNREPVRDHPCIHLRAIDQPAPTVIELWVDEHEFAVRKTHVRLPTSAADETTTYEPRFDEPIPPSDFNREAGALRRQ